MAEPDQYRQIEEWGEEIDPREREGYPIMFHFRPNKFIAVKPDRLGDWEELTKREVGLARPDDGLRGWSGHPCETISGSNGGWDDSDCW